jgi:hypothetical protein
MKDKKPKVDTMSQEDIAALEAAGLHYDASVDDVFDEWGQLVDPGRVASTVMLTESPPAGSSWGGKRADLDDLFRPTRTEPNMLGQRVDPYPPGQPPGTFACQGSAIDSDGLAGASPAEMSSELPTTEPVTSEAIALISTSTPATTAAGRPLPDAQTEGREWTVGAGVSPPPSTLDRTQAAGAVLLGRLAPSGDSLKADTRSAHDGRYVNGQLHPPGTPRGPSHELLRFDLRR